MQVRKSFFNDLNINNNVSVVDLLYEQFYTGSAEPPTESERELMRRLFRNEDYVKHEYRYHNIIRRGQALIDEDDDKLDDWEEYLKKYGEYIEKGFQFTRMAVQEPYGVMVLQVLCCMQHTPYTIRSVLTLFVPHSASASRQCRREKE